jgi:hypothetical protein
MTPYQQPDGTPESMSSPMIQNIVSQNVYPSYQFGAYPPATYPAPSNGMPAPVCVPTKSQACPVGPTQYPPGSIN